MSKVNRTPNPGLRLDWIVPDEAFPDVEASAHDHTGVYAWPAGDRLARDLATTVECAGRRVLDIGCGRGHLGFTAWRLGAACVCFADGNAAVRAGVAAVIAANTAAATVVAHAWGEPVAGAPFDLVLGGDVLYRPALFAELLASVADAVGARGEALLSDPRHRLEAELPAIAAAAGLRWQAERRHDYTLVRLRRSG